MRAITHPPNAGRSISTRRRAFLSDDAAEGNPLNFILIGSIMVIISFVVALAFWPVLTSGVATAQGDANTTTTQSTVLGLIPLIFAVGLLVGGIAFLVSGIRGLTMR